MDFSEETMRSMLTVLGLAHFCALEHGCTGTFEVTFNCAAQMPIAGDIEHLFEMDKPAETCFKVQLSETDAGTTQASFLSVLFQLWLRVLRCVQA